MRFPSFAAALSLSLACASAHSECRLVRIAEWPLNGTSPIVEASLNGKKVGVLLDTGASTTVLTRSAAIRLGLPRENAPGVHGYGFGGETRVEIAEVAELRIGSATRKDWRVLAAGEHDQGPVALLLGDDFLENFDLELDFAHKAIRLFQPRDCARSSLAYWAPQDAFQVDIQPGRNIIVPVTINGVTLNALVDTGASASVLARQVAEAVHINPGGAGSTPAGCFVGLGKTAADGTFEPVDSFSLGNETIRNTHLAVSDFGRAFVPPELGSRLSKRSDAIPAMVLGMDFLTSHRVMLSRSQRKMYFTPDGNTVFPTKPRPACSERRADPQTRAARADQALQEDPNDVAALLRRARALVDQGDLDAAFVDFERVLALQPDNISAMFSRAAILQKRKDYRGAIAGYDAVLALKPGDPESLQNRGIAYTHVGRWDEAFADADRVLALYPRNKPALRIRGIAHYAAGRYAAAVHDLAEWQRLAPEDDYAALWLYLARTRSGQDASAQLFNYRRQSQSSKWPAPILRFYLDEIDGEALMAAAARGEGKRQEQECEARFNIGERHMIDARAAAGIAMLRQAVETCPDDFDEYLSASAELKRLR